MNKKLLFGIMSLAALAACTNDDFENQGAVAEQTSPIQFEVINGDASMRASMNKADKIVWSAAEGDLFTLYHGATLGEVTGYQNATYKAEASDGGTAKLTTPSMINKGGAVMVWPVDTAFRYRTDGKLMISIPNKQKKDVANYIPYMSDQIEIGDYDGVKAPYNTEGYGRTYPVYMRPMASQLILHADYAGTDATLKTLEEGEDGIDPIELTSVALQTSESGSTKFTTKVAVKFSDPDAATSKWSTVSNNAWKKVTDFNLLDVVVEPQLTTECITGTESAKFLVLPQNDINTATSGAGVTDAAVVFNTTYGKVVVAPTDNVTNKGLYTTGDGGEITDAWYRYLGKDDANETYETKATSATEGKGYKTTTNLKQGLMQVIDVFSAYKTGKESSPVYKEPTGAAADRYVKVLLTHLDMSDLHVESDKQLRDVVRVWQTMGLPSVTVYLDGGKKGDAAGEFTISQKTIKKINEINAAVASAGRAFTVMPCQKNDDEKCTDIVITGGGDIQNIAFIKKNAGVTANVVLANETTAWKWNGTTDETKKVLVGEGVKRIFNKGTMVNDATATLAIWNVTYAPTTNVMTVGSQNTDLIFENDGTWDITGSTVLNVRFNVSNYGTVNIAEKAQYRQDGSAVCFHNLATTLPKRFLAADAEANVGVVNNSGVFATVNSGRINNYGGLIEHLTKNAKTYITKNQLGTGFASPFGGSNLMGRINLKYENKDEDNISISASAPITEGFVSITITEKNGEKDLKTSLVTNSFVNYIIVNGGVEKISDLDTKIKYVEIDQPGTEMVWNLSALASYDGLIILSPVNIKLGQDISANVTYLGADMYVGGTFNKAGTDWNGYYGNTLGNVATKYITF